ncbi:MAG TPA: GFA family protein [Solirubrobacteraceae bacterium]|nr:GFA family protein [Solirubrobacteraceae bacterium]
MELEEYSMEGGCLCGAVRFELRRAPLRAGYCHCTRCQRRTGTGSSVSAFVDPAALRWTRGEELIRGWLPPTDGAEKCFCSVCGAHLFSRSRDGTRVGIRMGAFDRDPGVRPSSRQFVADAASWEPIPDDGLPRFAAARPRDL